MVIRSGGAKTRNATITLAVVASLLLATIPGGAQAGKDIKNNSITGRDIKHGSLLAADFEPGQLPSGA